MGNRTAEERFAGSPLASDAFDFADAAYAGRVRSASGGLAYIEHPLAVARLLDEHGYSEEVVAAALLHDVIEDSEATQAQLRERFGRRVCELVAELSDDESFESFSQRKSEHRNRVREASAEALAIYAADKLTNLRTLRRAYADQGESVEEELSAPLDEKLSAWTEDCRMLDERIPELAFLGELKTAVAGLREDRSVADSPSRPV